MGMIIVGIYVSSITVGCLAVMWVLWRYNVRIELEERPCAKCSDQKINDLAKYSL